MPVWDEGFGVPKQNVPVVQKIYTSMYCVVVHVPSIPKPYMFVLLYISTYAVYICTNMYVRSQGVWNPLSCTTGWDCRCCLLEQVLDEGINYGTEWSIIYKYHYCMCVGISWIFFSSYIISFTFIYFLHISNIFIH